MLFPKKSGSPILQATATLRKSIGKLMERADYFKMIWTPKNPGSLMSELAVLGNKLILREPKVLVRCTMYVQEFLHLEQAVDR